MTRYWSKILFPGFLVRQALGALLRHICPLHITMATNQIYCQAFLVIRWSSRCAA